MRARMWTSTGGRVCTASRPGSASRRACGSRRRVTRSCSGCWWGWGSRRRTWERCISPGWRGGGVCGGGGGGGGRLVGRRPRGGGGRARRGGRGVFPHVRGVRPRGFCPGVGGQGAGGCFGPPPPRGGGGLGGGGERASPAR